MKTFFKNIIVFVVAVCLLCLCGCKGEVDNNSSLSQASVETEIVGSQLNNIAADQTVDPENSEVNRGDGAIVEIKNVQSVTGKANGIDVSKWQGRIDWQAVKKAGIDFAIIRIGYRGENGVIYRDENADYNIQQAQKAGVLVGIYFFSTAISVQEAKEEAVWTAEAIKDYKISYPVVYDCEGYSSEKSRMYGITSKVRTDNAIAFLQHIENSGYEGMLYAAKAELESSSCWETARIESKYKIWIAHYSSPCYPQKQTPDYNGKFDMWQYTNHGSVAGVEGNCDMVVSYFTVGEAAAKDSEAEPQTATAPKTQEELIYTDVSDTVTAKDEVNLREGPSTKYNIVKILKSGEFVTRTGIGTNGWSRLDLDGKTVYAITSYLSNEVIEVEKADIVNGIEFTPINDRVTAKIEVNLRQLPTKDSNAVGSIKAGEFLDRTAVSAAGWSRLTYNGQTVYAVTNYLTDTVPESNEEQSETVTEYGIAFTPVSVNVTAKEETNLRDKPTTDGSNIVYTLKNGEYIQKVGESREGWARLVYNGQTVYAIDSFLLQ